MVGCMAGWDDLDAWGDGKTLSSFSGFSGNYVRDGIGLSLRLTWEDVMLIMDSSLDLSAESSWALIGEAREVRGLGDFSLFWGRGTDDMFTSSFSSSSSSVVGWFCGGGAPPSSEFLQDFSS